MKAIGTKGAIKVVQILLSSYVPIAVDGIWGPKTTAAYESLDGDAKARVDSLVFVNSGRTVSSLRGEQTSKLALDVVSRTTEIPIGDAKYDLEPEPWEAQVAKGNVSVREVRDLIKELAAKEGVPEETALKFFWIESRFDPRAVSRTGARGVGQLTRVAIEDVRRHTGYVLRDPFDARDNITCSLKYMKIVAKYLKIALNDPTALYAAYNVGIGNAKHLLAGDRKSVV